MSNIQDEISMWAKRAEFLANFAMAQATTPEQRSHVNAILRGRYGEPYMRKNPKSDKHYRDHLKTELDGWVKRATQMGNYCKRLGIPDEVVRQGLGRFRPDAPRVTVAEMEAGLKKIRRTGKGIRYPREDA